MPSDIDEDTYKNENIIDLVQDLANAKAKKVAEKLLKCDLNSFDLRQIESVLGCDSMFEVQGKFFGKPKNHEEAIERLIMISANTGILHTGHCLLYRKKTKDKVGGSVFSYSFKKVVSTKIHFSEMSLVDIKKYVSTREPLGCAGGFSLDGNGARFIESIEGCFSNVIGISLPWLNKVINQI